MADQRNGGITWTEQTWNPLRGCQKVNDECRNCYAMRVAARFSGPGQPYHGLAKMDGGKAIWTGSIRTVPDHVFDPLTWKRSRLVFVNSMSDLFHDDLPEDDIDRIVAIMLLAKQHTFQALTKRFERMADYLTTPGRAGRIALAASRLLFDLETGRGGTPILGKVEKFGGQWLNRKRTDGSGDDAVITVPMVWPLPNVWWGFSAGRQASFDEAMPHICRMRPAASVIWWSAEPLLEAIDTAAPVTAQALRDGQVKSWLNVLDWGVVGGESQQGCRPMNLDWARAIRWDAGHRIIDGMANPMPFHMKQLGGHPNPRKKLDELPPDLRVRDYPNGYQRPAKPAGRTA